MTVAALHLDQRLGRAGRVLAYLAISVPIAVLGVLAVAVVLIGAVLSVAAGSDMVLASADPGVVPEMAAALVSRAQSDPAFAAQVDAAAARVLAAKR